MTFASEKLKLAALEAKKAEWEALKEKADSEKKVWLATCDEMKEAAAELDEIWDATIE